MTQFSSDLTLVGFLCTDLSLNADSRSYSGADYTKRCERLGTVDEQKKHPSNQARGVQEKDPGLGLVAI